MNTLQEEAEVKSDGTHTTLKPSQLSVARITVVRGSVSLSRVLITYPVSRHVVLCCRKGPLEGAPFIDDYIATSEQVVLV